MSSWRIGQALDWLKASSPEERLDLMLKARLITPEQAARGKKKLTDAQEAAGA